MQIKKHLEGGSLRPLMAEEIKRVLKSVSTTNQPYEHAALQLGISTRTLRVWTQPADKGGWKELEGATDCLGVTGTVEKLLRTKTKKRAKAKKAKAA
jgi:hypothetical protein